MSNKPTLKKIASILFFVVLLFLLNNSVSFAQDGKALFEANCTSCHAIKDKVIGPALAGTETRHSEEWLIKWIRNSQSLVKAGDAEAVKLFNDNNKIVMNSFSLKDEEIKAILAYVKEEANKVEVAPAPTAGIVNSGESKADKAKRTMIYLIVAGAILFLIFRVLRSVHAVLEKAVRQKQGLPEPEPKTRWRAFYDWARFNKKLVAVILICLFLYGSVKAWYGMMAIGISQGYTPDQPIAFNHTLHAGTNGIACVYCHVGADKGKTAGVPAANICMNCHKFIKKGPTTGTEEIAKIYKALDYDPDKGTYGPNQKPIQWVRVHNLPDLAYFNHAQHYVVGKIECQTCHGQVQDSMTVASQYSPLTMGWCVDCHRKTPVKMEGNAYYDNFHKEMQGKHKNDSVFTVEQIGGLECQRCHY